MIEVVFVHLGKEIPKHLVANIKIIKSNFKNLKIHLILDNELAIPKEEISFVKIHLLRVPELETRTLFELAPDPNFRNGFWKLTLERLFILGEFHKIYPETKFIHIESDVFLFPNFPLSKFEILERISWLKVSPTRDVAALVFFPNLTETLTFLKRMMDELRLGNWRDDMEMLSFLMTNFPNDYSYLPTLNPDHLELGSEEIKTKEIEKQLISNFEIFQGIFDGVHLGIWLAGWDPRNSYGITRIRDLSLISNAKGLLKPTNVEFLFDTDGSLKYFSNHKSTPVYSLHIHSKSLKIFSQDWKSEFERLINQPSKNDKFLEFNPRIFLSLLNESRRNRTLLAFILYSNKYSKRILQIFHPMILKVKKRIKKVGNK